MLFDAQNAGNRNSELLDFKFIWGSMLPDSLGKGPCGPFNGQSRLLHLQCPLLTNDIFSPGRSSFISRLEDTTFNMFKG